MPDAFSYRSLNACELVDKWQAYRDGVEWQDPRIEPMTVGEWKQN